ncbi:hypothetical protein GPOL_c40130 [Gordonia polyisoprenivorans VH2]|uniref:Uncharacterized protein n=1 Tax=Gordonia polyisoprenivorans (strain DSM 44266 / VH2) TaxID=1112204 RepID=H6MS07_GORPV|nr:hypothetical protein [Gordonia polyisoprenivorans]AFA75020.1 hypothetical protein GPOL_c40130 [Gordonia polyisoprenivorans VH2]
MVLPEVPTSADAYIVVRHDGLAPIYVALDLEEDDVDVYFDDPAKDPAFEGYSWRLSSATTSTVHSFLSSIARDLQVIVDGVSWDDEDERHLTSEAQAAVFEIGRAADSFDGDVALWSDADMPVDGLVEAATTDEELREIAEATHADLLATTAVWWEGAHEALAEHREALRDDLRTELIEASEDHSSASVRRDELITEVAAFESSYSIAEMTNLSPSTVQRIIRG